MSVLTKADLKTVAPVLAAFAGHGTCGKPTVKGTLITCACGQPLFEVGEPKAVAS